MATAAETTSIIQLVVGMVDAAPGADILAELEAILDAGSTVEEMAIAITENPAWSSDFGLFPDFLPNANFATEFLTQLIGSEVTAEVLAASITEMTADLNAGTSRGAAVYAAITTLAASEDADFANATLALANKTEVAEYYSVTIGASSESLDELISVVSSVDSSADAVADGTDAADDIAAAATPLIANLNTLSDAQDAVAAFLLAEGQTEATEAVDPPTTAIQLGLDYVAAVGVTDPLIAAGGYAAGTTAVKAALLAAQEAINTAARDLLQDAVDDADEDIADVAGLTSAVASVATATATGVATAAAVALDAIAQQAAEDSYDLNPLLDDVATGVVTLSGAGIVTAVADDGPNDLIQTNSSGNLELVFGITETTNPGITALMAAYTASNAAVSANNTAVATLAALTQAAASLDLGNVGAPAARAALGAGFTATAVVSAAAPTNAEVAAEVAALTATEDAGQAALSDDIGLVVFDTNTATTDTAHALLTAAAVGAGFIDAADATAIDAAFDAVIKTDQATTDLAITASQTVLAAAANAAGALATFDALITAYDAAELIDTPLIDVKDAADAALDTHVTTIDEPLADAVADETEAGVALATITALDAAVTAAQAALTDQDVVVTTIVATQDGTEDNDTYLLGTDGGTIDDFGAEGDDVIYIGDETYAVNEGDVDDDGDDTVLEIFLAESVGGDTTISIETSVFGSSAAEQEVIEVVLTGVAAADVVIGTDGFISVV